MSRKSCADCGTGLERNGVCPNCDEAAFIQDWQSDFLPENLSDEFQKESSEGWKRAHNRTR